MRLEIAALASLSVAAAAAQAQQPTVSRALAGIGPRDSGVAVWLLARHGYALAEIERLVVHLNGRVRHRSRWLHAVSAELTGAAIRTASTFSQLRHIQPVARFKGRRAYASTPVISRPHSTGSLTLDTLYGAAAMPLRRLNLFPLVEAGFRGAGVRIAILDTGFETEHDAFAAASVIAQRDFVSNDSVVRNEPLDMLRASQHGTAIWSLLAASLPNEIIGIAPDAEYILAKTEDVRSQTRVEEDNYVAALEWADSLGANVVISGLSYLQFDGGFSYSFTDLNGDVAVTTVAADAAAARGIVVVTGVGDRGAQGFRSLSTPADGDSVIAVGAEDSLGVLQSFSSRGPTFDGRLKPDLTAPGQDVFAVDPLSGSGFARFTGTSFTAPIIAGAAALLRQVHPMLTPIEILGALRRTGANRHQPDSSSGWGLPDATAAATFPRGIQVSRPLEATLQTITPLFDWNTPDVPLFARPLTYRLRVARDTTLSEVLLDTTLAETEVQLSTPLAPDERFVFELAATSTNSATLIVPAGTEFVVPEWVTLLTLNTPEGKTIRDRKPTFQWTSPDVVSPPGPFTYDLTVFRVDNRSAVLEASDLTDLQFLPPNDLDLNTPYKWRVIARLGSDSAVAESRSSFVIVDESLPTATLLFQNFPNPFPNRSAGLTATCIWFDLAEPGKVTLDILDVRGLIVRNLVPGYNFPATLPAGRYGRGESGSGGRCDPALQWSGDAADGSRVPRGIYLMRLKTEEATFFKRIVFLGDESQWN